MTFDEQAFFRAMLERHSIKYLSKFSNGLRHVHLDALPKSDVSEPKDMPLM